jgi:hypothetical protein
MSASADSGPSFVDIDVRQPNRAGGGGGPVGPFHCVGVTPGRGRVAEWPVADPILPVMLLTQDNATAK